MDMGSTAQKVVESPMRSAEDLDSFRERLLKERDPNRPYIIVCHGTGCRANGSVEVADELRKAMKEMI